jgi:LacI family transcriptional regulator
MQNEIQFRPVTIGDVARLAGVAKSTASAALNGREGKYAVSPEKRDAVLQAAQELRFEANPHAKRLSNGRDYGTVGLFTLDIDAGVGMHKLRQLQLVLTRAGYNVPIYSTGAPEIGDQQSHARLLASIRLQRPHAIVSANHLEDESLQELRRFQAEGGTIVTYDYECEIPCDQVVFDRVKNTYLATRHLLELGHRRIGFFVNGVMPKAEGCGHRYDGFMRALRDYGGETRKPWIVHSGNYESGTLNEGGGVLLAQKFLSWRERPTAMCIVNDASAAAFIASVGRAGLRVPQDISVVGHDDLPISAIFPTAITTVTHPVQAIAEGVADLLLSRLRGEYDGPPRRVEVQGELRVRESTTKL